MRVALFAWMLLGVLQLPAQQITSANPRVSSILQGMKSPNWAQRSEAFGKATNLSSAPGINHWDADRLRLGIFELLIKESTGGLKEPENETAENHGEGYGEDKSQYYSGLISFVAGLNDERAIPALLSAAGTGEMATGAVAGFGRKALDATLAQVKSEDSDKAIGALFVIQEMLKMRTVGDTDSHLRIKNALRSALASPEYEVRENAMWPIEFLDDREEFVPLLQAIAEHDPYKSPYAVGNGENGEENQYEVRHHARLLLLKIANHEPPGS